MGRPSGLWEKPLVRLAGETPSRCAAGVPRHAYESPPCLSTLGSPTPSTFRCRPSLFRIRHKAKMAHCKRVRLGAAKQQVSEARRPTQQAQKKTHERKSDMRA